MNTRNFHTNFKLQNKLFLNAEELLSYSSTISKDLQDFLTDWFSSKEIITVQTSGSTGKPKRINLQKQQMINSALATGTFFSLPPKTSALLCLPINFIAGKMMIVRALTLGWELDIIPPSSYPLKSISKSYDFCAMVPLQVENSLEKLSFIKTLIVGGGVVSNKLQQKLQDCSTHIFATYGMTETITHIAIKKINNFSKGNKTHHNYYKVLPNTTIYQDKHNCLVIKNSKIASDVVFTNDVVKLVSDNKFEWLGRVDNVINSGGIKLHPESIEEKLGTVIDSPFFVTAFSDEKFGQKLVLVVERTISNKETQAKILLEKIKKSNILHKFEIPKEIIYLNNFNYTSTGKVQRTKTLRQL